MAAARFEDIIAALERAQVRYVVAGGFAVNLHGFLRFTKDLDLLIDLDPAMPCWPCACCLRWA